MKQVKVTLGKKGSHDRQEQLNEADEELKSTLERLKKKGLNPMQMCNKLIEHDVPAPGGRAWDYERVVGECKRLKV